MRPTLPVEILAQIVQQVSLYCHLASPDDYRFEAPSKRPLAMLACTSRTFSQSRASYHIAIQILKISTAALVLPLLYDSLSLRDLSSEGLEAALENPSLSQLVRHCDWSIGTFLTDNDKWLSADPNDVFPEHDVEIAMQEAYENAHYTLKTSMTNLRYLTAVKSLWIDVDITWLTTKLRVPFDTYLAEPDVSAVKALPLVESLLELCINMDDSFLSGCCPAINELPFLCQKLQRLQIIGTTWRLPSPYTPSRTLNRVVIDVFTNSSDEFWDIMDSLRAHQRTLEDVEIQLGPNTGCLEEEEDMDCISASLRYIRKVSLRWLQGNLNLNTWRILFSGLHDCNHLDLGFSDGCADSICRAITNTLQTSGVTLPLLKRLHIAFYHNCGIKVLQPVIACISSLASSRRQVHATLPLLETLNLAIMSPSLKETHGMSRGEARLHVQELFEQVWAEKDDALRIDGIWETKGEGKLRMHTAEDGDMVAVWS